MTDIITLTDNFTDNSLNTAKWSKEGSHASEIAEQNNRLEISHTALAEYETLISNNTFDLTDSSLTVRIPDAGNQTLASHGAYIGVRINTSNTLFLVIQNNYLYAYKKVSGTQTQIGTQIAYSATDHLWLRIREFKGKIYFDTSPDSHIWTNRWSCDNPFAVTALTVYLQSGSWQDETAGSYAYFNDLNVPSVVYPYHFEIDRKI